MPVVGQTIRDFSPPAGDDHGPVYVSRWRHKTFPTRQAAPAGTEQRMRHSISPKTLGPRDKKANWNDNAHDFDVVRNANVTGDFRRNLGRNTRHYSFGYEDHCRHEDGSIVADILQSEAQAERHALYAGGRAGARTEALTRTRPRTDGGGALALKVKVGSGAPYYTDEVDEAEAVIGFPPKLHRRIRCYNFPRSGSPGKDDTVTDTGCPYVPYFEGSAGAPTKVVHKSRSRKNYSMGELPETVQHHSGVAPQTLHGPPPARNMMHRHRGSPARPADIAQGVPASRPEAALCSGHAGRPTPPPREAWPADHKMGDMEQSDKGIRVFPNAPWSHLRDRCQEEEAADPATWGDWELPDNYYGHSASPSRPSRLPRGPAGASRSPVPSQRRMLLHEDCFDDAAGQRCRDGAREASQASFNGAAGQSTMSRQEATEWQGPGRSHGSRAFRRMVVHKPGIGSEVLRNGKVEDQPGHATLHRNVADPYGGIAGRSGWEGPLQIRGPGCDWPVNMHLRNFHASEPPWRSRSSPAVAAAAGHRSMSPRGPWRVIPGGATPPPPPVAGGDLAHGARRSSPPRRATSPPRGPASRSPAARFATGRSLTPPSLTPRSGTSRGCTPRQAAFDEEVSCEGSLLEPLDCSSRGGAPAWMPSSSDIGSVVEDTAPRGRPSAPARPRSGTPRGITHFAEAYGAGRAPYELDESRSPRHGTSRGFGGSYFPERDLTPPPQRSRDARKWPDRDLTPRHYRQPPKNMKEPSGWNFFQHCA